MSIRMMDISKLVADLEPHAPPVLQAPLDHVRLVNDPIHEQHPWTRATMQQN